MGPRMKAVKYLWVPMGFRLASCHCHSAQVFRTMAGGDYRGINSASVQPKESLEGQGFSNEELFILTAFHFFQVRLSDE